MATGQVGSYAGYPIYSVREAIEAATENGQGLEIFFGKANSFTCSVGPNPGIGYVLMRRGDVKELVHNYAPPYSFHALTLGHDVDGYNVTFPLLTVTRAVNIFASAPDDDDTLMLVELADIRILGRLYTFTGMYNWSCPYDPAYYSVPGSGSGKAVAGAWVETFRAWYPEQMTTVPGTGTTRCPQPLPPSCYPWTWAEIMQDIWCRIFNLCSKISANQDADVPFWSTDFTALSDLSAHPSRILFYMKPVFEAFCELLTLYGGLILCYNPIYDRLSVELSGADNGIVTDVMNNVYADRLIYSSNDIEYLGVAYPPVFMASYLVNGVSPEVRYRRYGIVPELVVMKDAVPPDTFAGSAFRSVIGPPDPFAAQYQYPDWPIVIYRPLLAAHVAITPESYLSIMYGSCVYSIDQQNHVWCSGGNVPLQDGSIVPLSMDRIAERYSYTVYAPWPRREVFSGCIPVFPSSRSHTVIWKDFGGGFVTEVLYHPKQLPLFATHRERVPRDTCYCPTTTTTTTTANPWPWSTMFPPATCPPMSTTYPPYF